MRKRVGKILSIMVIAMVAVIVIVLVAFTAIFAKKTFQYETYINGTEVSFLSPEGASRKMLEQMNKTTLNLIFAEDKTYTCVGSYFDFELEDMEALENIISEQNKGTEDVKKYEGIEIYRVDEEKVRDYLASLSVFHETNIRAPENAYLDFDKNNHVVIKPEVYGNEIDFEEAYQYMLDALKTGTTTIDFRGITNINPSILSTDEKLVEQANSINKILSTTIHYQLPDGSTYTLDAVTMKNWVYRNEDGYYGIDIDGNLPAFVETLSQKAQYLIPSTDFNATGIGKIKVSFGRKTYATLNQEQEIERIKENLGTAKTFEWEPTYNPLPDYTNIDTYVELDISRQRVWMYVNGKCILDTPCVTGNVAGGHSTPIGIYHLTYKTRNTYLTDGETYNSFVNYWMPFNGDIGFHDADGWRSNYGGNIYLTNGSHGCVNLPKWAAKILYQNINTSIPIILYS